MNLRDEMCRGARSFTPAIILLAIAWSHCPPDPLLWLQLREPVLQLLYQPWLVLPLLG